MISVMNDGNIFKMCTMFKSCVYFQFCTQIEIWGTVQRFFVSKKLLEMHYKTGFSHIYTILYGATDVIVYPTQC